MYKKYRYENDPSYLDNDIRDLHEILNSFISSNDGYY